MDYLNTVPFQALDQFYFETIEQMPAQLRVLPVELRLLRSKTAEQPISTLKTLYTNDYLFLPWWLDDVFDVSVETALSIGQASTLVAISCVMLDRLVDRQMPDQSTIPLAQQYLLLKGCQMLTGRNMLPATFVEETVYSSLFEFIEALALEADCMDTNPGTYSYEKMERVCTGKAGPLRAVARAMAFKSSQPESRLQVVNGVLNAIVLADQLSDDALDWRKDYQTGRYTLPAVLARQASGVDLGNNQALSAGELELILEDKAILIEILNRAIAVLEEAAATLEEHSLAHSKLGSFIQARLEKVHREKRFNHAIRLVGMFARSL